MSGSRAVDLWGWVYAFTAFTAVLVHVPIVWSAMFFVIAHTHWVGARILAALEAKQQ